MEITKNDYNYAYVYTPTGLNLHEGFLSYWCTLSTTGAIQLEFVDGYKVMTSINHMYMIHKEPES